MNIGDRVKWQTEDGETLTGVIVCVYVVPKDYNLVDIETEEGVIYGVSTEVLAKVEE